MEFAPVYLAFSQGQGLYGGASIGIEAAVSKASLASKD